MTKELPPTQPQMVRWPSGDEVKIAFETWGHEIHFPITVGKHGDMKSIFQPLSAE
jgi:hypothetical protein